MHTAVHVAMLPMLLNVQLANCQGLNTAFVNTLVRAQLKGCLELNSYASATTGAAVPAQCWCRDAAAVAPTVFTDTVQISSVYGMLQRQM